jgi:hypothetical protein
MQIRTCASILLLVAGVGLPAITPSVASAGGATVQVTGDSASLDWFQAADTSHQASGDISSDTFLRYGKHRAPKRVSAIEGTADSSTSQASTIETPAQPPFPLGPVGDIAMTGTATSHATTTGKGPYVPNADSDGAFRADFSLSTAVPVFFSGALLATNTDPSDSCAEVTVDLTGPTSRHFEVEAGNCTGKQPRSRGWAQSLTLPSGSEYELTVDYSTEVDADTVKPKSVFESATASVNLSFFPPTAHLSRTLSGSTASFNGSRSHVGQAGLTLASWRWTFGDGRTATTKTPRVKHTYPTSPRRAPRYRATLQVVDSEGGISPPVTVTIAGTSTTAHAKHARSKLAVSGAVTPARRGKHVVITLERKHHGHFARVSSQRATLDRHSHFSASLSRAPAGQCLVLARYPGDATHLASQTQVKLAC